MILFSDNHDLHGAGSAASLVPIDEMDTSEFAEICSTIIEYNCYASPDDRGTKMCVGIMTTEIVLTVFFGKLQRLGAGMHIHSLMAAGRYPFLKHIYQILL